MEREETENCLREFGAELQRISAPIVANLREGLDRGLIEARLRTAVGVTARSDLVEWYASKNGTTISMADGAHGVHSVRGQQLVSSWYLLSLEQSITFHNRAHSLARERGRSYWHPDGWFPFLQGIDGSMLCMDTADGTLYVIDLEVQPYGTPREPQSPSLCHFVGTHTDFLAQHQLVI